MVTNSKQKSSGSLLKSQPPRIPSLSSPGTEGNFCRERSPAPAPPAGPEGHKRVAQKANKSVQPSPADPFTWLRGAQVLSANTPQASKFREKTRLPPIPSGKAKHVLLTGTSKKKNQEQTLPHATAPNAKQLRSPAFSTMQLHLIADNV